MNKEAAVQSLTDTMAKFTAYIGKRLFLKIEAVEQSILIALLLPHHLGCPIASMQMGYFTMGVFQQH